MNVTYLPPAGFPDLPSDWEADSLLLDAADGATKIFVHVFKRKQGSLNRLLFVSPGFGEHGGRYIHFPHYLKDQVDQVIAIDHRGHGRSQGLRGHADQGFDQLVDDLEVVLKKVLAIQEGQGRKIELHLFGHSMGGHLLLRLLRRWEKEKSYPVQSASVSAPFFAPAGKPPAVKVMAAHVLANLWGHLQLGTELDASTISRDPAVVKAYLGDKLNHDKMTPKFYTTMMKCVDDTLSHTGGISCPLQFQIPMQDKLVDAKLALGYFEKLQLREKKLKTYAQGFHEPMNDLDKELFFADLREWIKEHSQK